MKINRLFIIYRIAEYGDLIVYRRGNWHRQHHVPKYLVSRESTGRDLGEFRRKASAIKWAQQQPEGKPIIDEEEETT